LLILIVEIDSIYKFTISVKEHELIGYFG